MSAPRAKATKDLRVPVTLLAGFLGSGKTTLLNRILDGKHGQKCAVIVNEFGDVPIDGQLVVGAKDELVELANGCVCCTVRGDLLDTLAWLVRGRKKRLDRIVIEASGLASPGPAAATMHMPDLIADLRLDGIVTLAHGAGVADQIMKHPEAGEQLAFADLIVLNHCDRCDASELARAEAAIRACNEAAPLVRTERAAVDIDSLFGLGEEGKELRLATFPSGEIPHAEHTQGMLSLTLESHDLLRMEELKYWVGFLGERRDQELMRAKGVLRCVGKQSPVVVQVVGRWLEMGEDKRLPMPSVSRLQLIGRNLDRGELERGWVACLEQGGASP
ncbi:MAG: GTP-binding protein [Planctomycetota bacterium]|nr:GTP-binding protein [Planctomycetota bacterium]